MRFLLGLAGLALIGGVMFIKARERARQEGLLFLGVTSLLGAATASSSSEV
jgi:hypothetical protein